MLFYYRGDDLFERLIGYTKGCQEEGKRDTAMTIEIVVCEWKCEHIGLYPCARHLGSRDPNLSLCLHGERSTLCHHLAYHCNGDLLVLWDASDQCLRLHQIG